MKKRIKQTAQDFKQRHVLAKALRSVALLATPAQVAQPMADIVENLVWLPAETLGHLDVLVKHQMDALPADVQTAARRSKVRGRREAAALHRRLTKSMEREAVANA